MRGRNFKNLPSSGFPNPKKRKRKEAEWEKEERKGGREKNWEVRNKMLKADTLYMCKQTERKTNKRGIKNKHKQQKRTAKRIRLGLVGAA